MMMDRESRPAMRDRTDIGKGSTSLRLVTPGMYLMIERRQSPIPAIFAFQSLSRLERQDLRKPWRMKRSLLEKDTYRSQ